MAKLNKNGITSIELIACFIIVSVITVSMYNMIMIYKNKQQIAAINNEVMAYVNNIQKVIQDDLIKRGLKRCDIINNSISMKRASLQFDTAELEYGYPNDVSEIVISQFSIEYDNITYHIPSIEDLEIDMEESTIEVSSHGAFGISDELYITIVLSHPNFDNKRYIFRIYSPIGFTFH